MKSGDTAQEQKKAAVGGGRGPWVGQTSRGLLLQEAAVCFQCETKSHW